MPKIFMILALLLFFSVNSYAESKDDEYWDMWDQAWQTGLIKYDHYGNALEKQPALPLNPVKFSYENFDLFFLLFSEDEKFQDAFIHFPLTYSYLVDAPESDEIQTVYFVKPPGLTLARIFPDRGQRGKSLNYNIDAYNLGRVEVTLRGGETSFNIQYIFERDWGGECWYLTEIHNNSF